MKRKHISMMLAIIMAFALIPSFAFASEEPSSDPAEPSYNIEDYTFKLSQDTYYYDGKAHMPDVICDDLDASAYSVEYQREQGEEYIEYYDEDGDVYDYDFEYYDREPTGAGTYSVYITGVEPYTGSVELKYTIIKTSISLNRTSAVLYRKGTLQLEATVKNANGKTTYSSSNTKAATVSTGGKITAKAPGTAVITVKNGFAKETVKVTVKNPYLNKKSISLIKKKSLLLKVTGKIGKVTFKSSNKKIATVSSKGKIIAKKKGKCTITVKCNGITLNCKVTVKNPPPVYITRTGKRYHCDPDCWGLRHARAVYKVSLAKAKKKKLTPCHVCY